MTHRAQEQTVSERQQRTGETRASGQGSMIVRTIRRNPQRTTTSIAVIKGVHSLVFLSMAASILYTLYSGLTNRISRLTVVSIAAVIGEGLVLSMNGMRCPLTDLVEDLGSEHGSVSDIFLPAWVAERIPVLFTPPFAVGLAAIGVRRTRRQPAVATMCTIVAGLFLVAPWLCQLKERRSGGAGVSSPESSPSWR